MAIVVSCKCGQRFQARDEWAGRRTKCPTCGADLVIPAKAGRPGAASPTTKARTSAGKPATTNQPEGQRELTIEEMLKLARSMETLAGTGEIQSKPVAPPSAPLGPPMPAAAISAKPKGGKGLLIGGLAGGGILAVAIAAVVYFFFVRPWETHKTSNTSTQVAVDTKPPGTTPKAEELTAARQQDEPQTPATTDTSDAQKPQPPSAPPDQAKTTNATPMDSEPEEPASPIPAAKSLGAIPFLVDQLRIQPDDTNAGQGDTSQWKHFEGDGYEAAFPGLPSDDLRSLRPGPPSEADLSLRCAIVRHDKWGMAFAVCHFGLPPEPSAPLLVNEILEKLTWGAKSVTRNSVLDEDGGARATVEHVRDGITSTTAIRCVASSDYFVVAAAANANFSSPRAKKFIDSFYITGPRGWPTFTSKELGFAIAGPGKPVQSPTSHEIDMRGERTSLRDQISFLGQQRELYRVERFLLPKESSVSPQQWLKDRLKGTVRRRRAVTSGNVRGEEVWIPAGKLQDGTQLIHMIRSYVVGSAVYIISTYDVPVPKGESLPDKLSRFFGSLEFLPDAGKGDAGGKAAERPSEKPAEWRLFTSKELGFSVEAPGDPSTQDVSDDKIAGHSFVFSGGKDGGFCIECYVLPSDQSSSASDFMKGMLKQYGGDDVKNRRAISLGKFKGEEVWRDAAVSQTRGKLVDILRGYVVQDRVYLVMARDTPEPKGTKLSGRLQQFFDSFRILSADSK
ncbi:MAG: hypothetical protein HYS13_01420 [Planctomycetia bacterium]|nr:hypothetical protein [Planctomycetia bacterium]